MGHSYPPEHVHFGTSNMMMRFFSRMLANSQSSGTSKRNPHGLFCMFKIPYLRISMLVADTSDL